MDCSWLKMMVAISCFNFSFSSRVVTNLSTTPDMSCNRLPVNAEPIFLNIDMALVFLSVHAEHKFIVGNVNQLVVADFGFENLVAVA